MDSMLFGQSTGGIVAKGHISNKTEAIALFYDTRKDALNIKELHDLQCDLRVVTVQMIRIRHYISLLDKRQGEILTLIYIDGLMIIEVMERLSLSPRTVYRNRDNAISELMEMFQRVSVK